MPATMEKLPTKAEFLAGSECEEIPDDCDCRACREREERAALIKMCEAWNWDAGPVEIAQELGEEYGAYFEDYWEIVERAMLVFGFPKDQVSAVEDACYALGVL